MDKREFERRHLNAQCVVRYAALDDRSIEEATGMTLNVCRGGLGLLANLSLRRGTEVHVYVWTEDGRSSHFTGAITHSLPDNKDRYVIGVQFCRVSDERLAMSDPERVEEVAPDSDGTEPASVEKAKVRVEAGEPG